MSYTVVLFDNYVGGRERCGNLITFIPSESLFYSLVFYSYFSPINSLLAREIVRDVTSLIVNDFHKTMRINDRLSGKKIRIFFIVDR